MTLKIAFAAVLKAMRAGKGLTQRNLAGVGSRTYVSKLEHAQSKSHAGDDDGIERAAQSESYDPSSHYSLR